MISDFSSQKISANSKNLKYSKKSLIFDPIDANSPLFVFWLVFDLFFVLFSLFKLPFESVFQSELFGENAHKFNIFSLIFAIFGIFLNFNTKIFTKEKLESLRANIAKHYIRSYFLIDFLGLLAILLHFSQKIQFFSFLYCVKAISVQRTFRKLEKLSFCRFFEFFSTTVFLLNFFTFLHFLSCFWFLTEKTSDFSFENRDKIFDYFFSIYYINSNINFMANSPILPQKTSEILWVLSLNFIAFSFIVYLYQRIFMKNSQKDLILLNNFMKKREISSNLRRKINDYLVDFHGKDQENSNSLRIIENIGENLKKQLFLEAYLPILASIRFFSKNFSQNSLNSLTKLIKEKDFFPGETLSEDFLNKTFYFIIEGEFDVFFSKNSPELVIKKLYSGDSFGEFSFFNEKFEILHMKSSGNSSVLTLNFDDFYSVITKNPRDYEVFCQIKDEILLYGNSFKLYKTCYFCKNSSHFLTNCPLIHYFPSAFRIKGQAFYKDKLSRRSFQRKITRNQRQNALKNYTRNLEKAVKTQSKENMTSNSRKKSIKSVNNVNNYEEKDIFSSTSSYTQKKNTTENCINGPLVNSDTFSMKVQANDSLSQRIFSILNENRMLYHNVFTEKSISSESPNNHIFERSFEKSSDFRNIDLKNYSKNSVKNSLKNVKNYTKNLKSPLNFEKNQFSSISFEEVKIWPNYFKMNNVLNIIKEINTKKNTNKSLNSLKVKKKEEKSKNSLSSSKNVPKKTSQESLLQKNTRRKPFIKSKTSLETPKKLNFFEKVKTFFLE